MNTPTTDTTTPKLIQVLNTCIEICLDGEKGYAIAATNVRDEALKSLFHEYAADREGFVRALQQAITKLGGYAENEGSAKGAVHRAFTSTRIALEGRKDEVILGECERGDLAAIAAYDAAFQVMPLDRMPTEIRAMLVEQRAAIREAYEKITHEDVRRRVRH